MNIKIIKPDGDVPYYELGYLDVDSYECIMRCLHESHERQANNLYSEMYKMRLYR